MSEGSSTGSSSSPEPPEPMDLEESGGLDSTAGDLEEAVREAVGGQGEGEDAVDLPAVARQFAQYLVVDSKQDKQLLDDRIESVVFRVEEFKSQLEHVQHNMVSNAEKVDDIHSYVQQLKDLYVRVDQVDAFVGVVTQRVNALEEAVSKAEKDLDPSKFRKVFFSFPKLGKSKGSKSDVSVNWTPPKPFKASKYFTTYSPTK